MKKLFQTNGWLYLADLLLLPSWWAGARLSEYMLARQTACPWTRFGGKCVTCGGTHFVNALLHLRLGEAFGHNPFLFLLTVFLLFSFILLHVWRIRRCPLAKRILDTCYSIPSLIVWLAAMLVFFLVRNLPLFCAVLQRFV